MSWASRSALASRGATGAEAIPEESGSAGHTPPTEIPERDTQWMSPIDGHIVDESPQPWLSTASSSQQLQASPAPQQTPQSAPAELIQGRKPLSKFSSKERWGTDELPTFHPTIQSLEHSGSGEGDFELDRSAPERAMKHPELASAGPSSSLDLVLEEEDREGSSEEEKLEGAKERVDADPISDPSGPESPPAEDPGREGWGESFKIEWISTTKLPFNRTRHLRNPWNHNREIKVSRDGTELEPSVGQQLLDQWETLARNPPDENPHESRGGGRFKGRPRDNNPRRNTRS